MRLLLLLLSLLPVLAVAPAGAESLFVKGKPNLTVQEEDSVVCRPRFASLIKQINQSVVNIAVKPGTGTGASKKQAQPGDLRSVGSGFIATKDGYIVTNFHVIENADQIVVRLTDDRREYKAELIGEDSKTDLALLKIKPDQELSPVFIGNSDDVEVGEWVIAIGNQFQLGQTVTAGIVSAKARKVPNKPSSSYDSFIQTDASINPGSSGGPLFNTRGEVIGINTAIFSPGRGPLFGGTGFNIGIGFSIPINLASSVLEQIRETGSVTRGGLGVIIQHIDSKMSNALGYNNQAGALVADIVDGSPAALAGFQIKDVIVSYNGEPVKDHDDLPLMVAGTDVGASAKVEVLRRGKLVALNPVIQDLSKMAFPGAAEAPKKEEARYNSLGLHVEDITSELAESMELDSDSGVVVMKIKPDSAAYLAGLARGDVIMEIDHMPVVDTKTFDGLVNALPVEKPVLVVFRRKEGGRLTTVTKTADESAVVEAEPVEEEKDKPLEKEEK